MFRNAVESDLDAVYRLMCALEERALPYDDFARISRAQGASPALQGIVATSGPDDTAENLGDERVAAFINLRYEDQLHHAARIAEVLELVVDPAERSHGLGGALFDHACEEARAHGCQQIELTTNQLRHDAHRFYARKGMLNSHYKFTLPLDTEPGDAPRENRIGC